MQVFNDRVNPYNEALRNRRFDNLQGYMDSRNLEILHSLIHNFAIQYKLKLESSYLIW